MKSGGNARMDNIEKENIKNEDIEIENIEIKKTKKKITWKSFTEDIKSIFSDTTEDYFIKSLENNESLEKRIIACRKQLYSLKKIKERTFKHAVIAIAACIVSCYLGFMEYNSNVNYYEKIYSIYETIKMDYSRYIQGVEYEGDISAMKKIDDAIAGKNSIDVVRFAIIILMFIISFIYLFSCLITIFLSESVKPYKELLLSYEEELELQEFYIDTNKKHYIDDKRFQQHQRELKRYYDMNLEQSKLLFYLGVTIIILGTIIVLTTIFLLYYNSVSIIPVISGCVSGIFTDFIGFLFINMYSKNIKASIKYHKKLVKSNNLLLSSAIIGRIDNKDKKDDAYSRIAHEIPRVDYNDIISHDSNERS